MKIDTVKITRYRAFLATEEIKIKSKNIFIYGENGSGKSSFYYALKDFFQSSAEDVDFSKYQNIFIPESLSGSDKIEVSFKDNGTTKSYYAGSQGKDHGDDADTLVADSNRLKSFFTYKHLLDVHHVKTGGRINLFDFLVKGVLRHYKSLLTEGKELAELWQDVELEISRKRTRQWKITQKTPAVDRALEAFNFAFRELFDTTSPASIMSHVRPIFEKFDHNVEIGLTFPMVRPSEDYNSLDNVKVNLSVKYAGKDIDTPHLFLNEAKLSAIAISIYLGMIKSQPQALEYKPLFLDDVFIGLDICNRMPLLKILEEDFADYQIFVTTYDKPWYEFVRGQLDKDKWEKVEFYARKTNEGYEYPYINNETDFLRKAEELLQNSDYKAAAVYARTAFEKLLCRHCDKNRTPIKFHIKQKKYKSEDFWVAVKNRLDQTLVSDVEQYRSLVLNPFSHYDTENHEIRTELEGTIETIKKLKQELSEL